MKISDAGLAIIKEFESLQLKAYLCPAQVWTIGYGHTGGVQKGQVIDESEADAFLREDVEKFEECVSYAVPDLTQPQFDACVSLAFNIGCNAFAQSTLVKMLKAGNVAGAADQFLRWNKGGGKVLPGLTRRRTAERELFLQVTAET